MGGDRNQYWDEGMRHAHDGWWGGPLDVIVLLLLLALLVAAVVWLVRYFSRGGFAPAAAGPALPAAPAGSDPAIAALRMRYAKGEVSREEFQHAMEDLGGVAGPAPGGEDAPPTAN
jgi:uncharacterized membrane protein